MELSEEDVPPEEIWHHEARMTEWFDEVKARRKAGSGASHDEEVPLTDNEHAEDYR